MELIFDKPDNLSRSFLVAVSGAIRGNGRPSTTGGISEPCPPKILLVPPKDFFCPPLLPLPPQSRYSGAGPDKWASGGLQISFRRFNPKIQTVKYVLDST